MVKETSVSGHKRTGDLFGVLCALVCGLGMVPHKHVLSEGITPELFNLFFFGFAFLISNGMLISRSRRKVIFHIRLKALGLIVLLSLFLSIAIHFYSTALDKTEPATASFLARMECVVTVFLAIVFLKEVLRKLEIVGGAIALIGVFVLMFTRSGGTAEAAMLMLVSSFFFGLSETLLKKNLKLVGTTQFLYWRNLSMTVFFVLILQGRGQAFSVPEGDLLWLIAAASLLMPILGRAFYIEAMKRMNISRVALVTQLTPLFAALFGYIFLESVLSLQKWVGGGLIVVGVVVLELGNHVGVWYHGRNGKIQEEKKTAK